MAGENTFFILKDARLEIHSLQDVASQTIHHWQSFSKKLEKDASNEDQSQNYLVLQRL